MSLLLSTLLIQKGRNLTTSLELYQDARRKMSPINSLYYTIVDAGENHPSLKNHINQDGHDLIASINRSARILLSSLADIEIFLSNKVNEPTVGFVESLFFRAYAHLVYYIGKNTVNAFIDDCTKDHDILSKIRNDFEREPYG
jgi:hypothetical protein